MTINQAIDLIYNYSNIDQFPKVKDLRHKLSLLKMKHGGNTQIENPELISGVIKSVEENPKNKTS
jgi:hypothetical protein